MKRHTRMRHLLTVVVAALVALVLSGCGNDKFTQPSGPTGTSGTTAGTVVTPTTGTVAVTVALPTSKTASAVPAATASFRVRVIDPSTGLDLVAPVVVARQAGATSQTFTISNVPAQQVQVLVVALDANGDVLGVDSTDATVQAGGTSSVTVTDVATVTGLTVQPGSATVAVGASTSFVAIATLSDSTSANVTSEAAWTSTSQQVGVVNSVGVATGITAGSAGIGANYLGVTGSATLTVTGASPTPTPTATPTPSPTATPSPSPTATPTPTPTPSAFTLTSSAFTNGGAIPVKYANTGVTGGQNISIPLAWTNVPVGTQAYAVSIVDQTAGGFVHWGVFNIAAQVSLGLPPVTSLAEGASAAGIVGTSGAAPQIRNDFGDFGYGGPEPPPGAPHTYIIGITALSQPLVGVDQNSTYQQVAAAIQQAGSLGEATLTGVFTNPGP